MAGAVGWRTECGRGADLLRSLAASQELVCGSSPSLAVPMPTSEKIPLTCTSTLPTHKSKAVWAVFHLPDTGSIQEKMEVKNVKVQADGPTGTVPGDTGHRSQGSKTPPEVARDTFLPNSLAQRCSIIASDFNSLSHGGHTVVPREGNGEEQKQAVSSGFL